MKKELQLALTEVKISEIRAAINLLSSINADSDIKHNLDIADFYLNHVQELVYMSQETIR